MRALGLVLLCLLVLAACGDDNASVEPTNPSRSADGLRFTREDGSTYEVQDAVASCTRSSTTGTQVVVLTGRAGSQQTPVTLRVPVGLSGVRRLPLGGDSGTSSPLGLSLVATDPRDGTVLTASQRPASGTLTVVEAECDPEPLMSMHIYGALRSRDGQPERVTGGLASVGGH